MTLLEKLYQTKQLIQNHLDGNPSSIYKAAPTMRDRVSPKKMRLELWVRFEDHNGETGYLRLDDYIKEQQWT